MSGRGTQANFPLKGTAPFLKRNHQEGCPYSVHSGEDKGCILGKPEMCSIFCFGFSWLVTTRYTHPYKKYVVL